ncbi:site-specific integrase [Planotetraspora sp. A-T 1434]|uniref:tyrosine-type recombinase/integrase n=1 Tax=Planotetraspora sp. A-T 1434 TaxID=2979219 RepID=UPI0021C24129|nr:site-specific integrase [Planotetraspora sp. A-T 1434]MCT9932263.1 site-specific integrase [Planotetraspora sp. A-T 1434]
MSEIIPAAASFLPDVAPRPPAQNPYLVYLKSLGGQQSRRTMGACLDGTARILGYPTGEAVPWGLLRYQHTTALRSELMNQVRIDADGEAAPWSPSTVNKHLSALRQVLYHAWMLGQMTAEDYQRAKAVKNVKGGTRAKAGRNIAEYEVAAMLKACLAAGGLIGIRDAAVIAVLQSTGMRRDELAKATRANYDPGDRSLAITGKGGKSREVYLHEVAAVYLGRWLAATEHIRGPLIAPVNRWGDARARHLSSDAIAAALERRRREAELPRLSPHDLRRTFAGDLLDNGVDLARVQQLMGHASPVTTSGYDRRPGRQRRAAIDTLTLPRPEDLATTK